MVARRSQPESVETGDGTTLPDALAARTREVEELRQRIADLENTGGQFLSAAAHATRNHLTVIQSYLEIIRSDLTTGLPDEHVAFLDVVYDNVVRLRQLTDDLIEVSALETGIAVGDMESTSVSDIVEDVCGEMRTLAERGGLTVSCETPDGPVRARIDPERMRDLLRRLLGNAVRFTRSGGSIRVCVIEDEDQVVIEVRDTGVGIPPERIGEVFEDFSQLHRKPGEQRQGFGLGLAIARRIARVFGGELEAESAVGEGSTLTVRIPAISGSED
jgi:signal transduction histidine kinase